MQNAIKEMCNLICYTKIEGDREIGVEVEDSISYPTDLDPDACFINK